MTFQWWCTSLARPWSWTPIAYPGIWLAALIPAFLFIRSACRRKRDVSKKDMALFLGGVLVFWVASDWPLGTLGAGYLASAHMVQFLLYTLGAAPLLLLGTPEWMARKALERIRAYRLVRSLSSSLIASGIAYNAILIVTHSPITVDTLRSNQFGSFFMDLAWLASGFILWLPILAPLPELRNHPPIAKMAYLFVTTSVVAVIPASFLTFTDLPIYRTYELAPRVWQLNAADDQQLAGIIMKIVTIPVIWSTIAALWFRWAGRETAIGR